MLPVANPYESDRLLSEYLLFHYGRDEEVLPYPFGPAGALDFAVRVVNECIDLTRLPAQARGLDLGCAVGRSSFELARWCHEVVGVDYSQNFIQAAAALRQIGCLPYERTDEGQLWTRLEATLPPGIDGSRVQFEVGDACNLRPDLGDFDVAILVNLVDRLKDPLRCLQRLSKLVRPRGQLVIASPYTWLEEYTPGENWLGGFERGNQRVHGFDSLCESLAGDFEFLRSVEIPFLIREHVRKFQWSVSLAGIWIRK